MYSWGGGNDFLIFWAISPFLMYPPEVNTGSGLAGFIQNKKIGKIGMCQFRIHLNNKKVWTQKYH